jgi:hypothetical protein
MPTPPDLVRTAALVGLAAGLISGAGCGQKDVAARTQPPRVSQWKCRVQNNIGIPKGIVVEEKGGLVRARFCDLKPGNRFEIASTLSHGTHFPDRKAIIFPLGMPESASLEQWVQAGGPHLRVAFDSHASRLTGDLTSSAGDQSFEFVRYE